MCPKRKGNHNQITNKTSSQSGLAWMLSLSCVSMVQLHWHPRKQDANELLKTTFSKISGRYWGCKAILLWSFLADCNTVRMRDILTPAKTGLALAYNFGSWDSRPLSNIDTSKTLISQQHRDSRKCKGDFEIVVGPYLREKEISREI